MTQWPQDLKSSLKQNNWGEFFDSLFAPVTHLSRNVDAQLAGVLANNQARGINVDVPNVPRTPAETLVATATDTAKTRPAATTIQFSDWTTAGALVALLVIVWWLFRRKP